MPVQHQNEENKALRTWGDQKSRNLESYGNGGTGIRFSGPINGGKSFRVCGENWEGENTFINAGREIDGGVLDQLIESVVEQLTDNANRKKILELQLRKLKAIRQATAIEDEK